SRSAPATGGSRPFRGRGTPPSRRGGGLRGRERRRPGRSRSPSRRRRRRRSSPCPAVDLPWDLDRPEPPFEIGDERRHVLPLRLLAEGGEPSPERQVRRARAGATQGPLEVRRAARKPLRRPAHPTHRAEVAILEVRLDHEQVAIPPAPPNDIL